MRRLALRARFPAVLTRRGGCDAAVLPPSRQNLKASRSVRPAGGLPPTCCAPRRRIGAATQARPGPANHHRGLPSPNSLGASGKAAGTAAWPPLRRRAPQQRGGSPAPQATDRREAL